MCWEAELIFYPVASITGSTELTFRPAAFVTRPVKILCHPAVLMGPVSTAVNLTAVVLNCQKSPVPRAVQLVLIDDLQPIPLHPQSATSSTFNRASEASSDNGLRHKDSGKGRSLSAGNSRRRSRSSSSGSLHPTLSQHTRKALINQGLARLYCRVTEPELHSFYDSRRKWKGTCRRYRLYAQIASVAPLVPSVRATQYFPNDKVLPTIVTLETDFIFCHCDLSQSNIIDNPETLKIEGIIDWEYGGYWPTFFESLFFRDPRPSGAQFKDNSGNTKFVKFFSVSKKTSLF
jgi:hypothetical protein